MFDFSFMEMLVVFVVGLLVFGPERLPRVARQVGWWVGRIRSSVATMREELERETQLKEFRDIEASIRETAREAENAVREAKSSVESAAGDPAADDARRGAP